MEFPGLGEHCNAPHCNKLDFLPVKCDACRKIFCSDHMSYAKHNCQSAQKKDVQVPVCPLCGSPVPTPRNQKPDITVSDHIDKNCRSDVTKEKKKVNSNKCSVHGCKIKEMIPVICSQCKKNYCLQHRFPDVHRCNKNGPSEGPLRHHKDTSQAHIKSVQGSMSEDEALAKALSESMKESEKIIRRNQNSTVQGSASPQRCRVS